MIRRFARPARSLALFALLAPVAATAAQRAGSTPATPPRPSTWICPTCDDAAIRVDKIAPVGIARDDGFGESIALSGDTVVVGASSATVQGYRYTGAVCVFVRNGSTWARQALLEPTDVPDPGHFGRAVALQGDRLVVGAPHDIVYAGSGSTIGGRRPAAYVYERVGGLWSASQTLLPSQQGKWFGCSVAVDGDTILVGARAENSNYRGAAYFFERVGSTWVESKRVVAPNRMDGDYFGADVALSGDTALIVAQGKGTAYVYRRIAGTWQYEQELTVPAHRVDVDGNRAVCFGYTGAGRFGGGYHLAVLRRIAGVWTSEWEDDEVYDPVLFNDDGYTRDRCVSGPFGSDIALDGSRFVASAAGPTSDGGFAALYEFDGITWVRRAVFQPSGIRPAASFGQSVAIEARALLVGAPGDWGVGGVGTGTAYEYGLGEGGQFESFGTGAPGRGGFVPLLTSDWTVVPGADYFVQIADGRGGTNGALLIGTELTALPFYGGTQYVGGDITIVPHTLEGAFGVAGDGGLCFQFHVPEGMVSGSRLVLQAYYPDSFAPGTRSLSNAIVVEIP